MERHTHSLNGRVGLALVLAELAKPTKRKNLSSFASIWKPLLDSLFKTAKK